MKDLLTINCLGIPSSPEASMAAIQSVWQHVRVAAQTAIGTVAICTGSVENMKHPHTNSLGIQTSVPEVSVTVTQPVWEHVSVAAQTSTETVSVYT
jgi:hypothetical protein